MAALDVQTVTEFPEFFVGYPPDPDQRLLLALKAIYDVLLEIQASIEKNR